MQHSVLDILLYLFDYLVYEKKTRPTIDEMQSELKAAGFAEKDIDRAIAWLLDLNDSQQKGMLCPPSSHAIRRFTQAEMAKISIDGRGFLHHLTQLGVIDALLREIIIQKLMVLDDSEITLDDIKWVVLMAILNQPEQEANAVWLEQLILNDANMVRAN